MFFSALSYIFAKMGEYLKDFMDSGMDKLREKFGGKKWKGKKAANTRLRLESNPFVQLFAKIPLFNDVFKDPELHFIDNFATVMYVMAAVLLSLCLPCSLSRFQCFSCLRQRFNGIGSWVLWLVDYTLRACVVLASVFCVWIPANKAAQYVFPKAEHGAAFKEYLKDPDSFQPVISNGGTTLPSYILAGSFMLFALIMFVCRMQKAIADDPEVLQREMEEVRRKQAEATRRGSGDMPAAHKEDDKAAAVSDAPVKVRKTPLRACRLRSPLGASSDAN